ncbi:MAG: hypothetical protein AAF492_29110, partial [Verrucomicrobiota bacterium]
MKEKLVSLLGFALLLSACSSNNLNTGSSGMNLFGGKSVEAKEDLEKAEAQARLAAEIYRANPSVASIEQAIGIIIEAQRHDPNDVYLPKFRSFFHKKHVEYSLAEAAAAPKTPLKDLVAEQPKSYDELDITSGSTKIRTDDDVRTGRVLDAVDESSSFGFPDSSDSVLAVQPPPEPPAEIKLPDGESLDDIISAISEPADLPDTAGTVTDLSPEASIDELISAANNTEKPVRKPSTDITDLTLDDSVESLITGGTDPVGIDAPPPESVDEPIDDALGDLLGASDPDMELKETTDTVSDTPVDNPLENSLNDLLGASDPVSEPLDDPPAEASSAGNPLDGSLDDLLRAS